MNTIIDSLPYIDYQDADYEEYALSLIEHEMNYRSISEGEEDNDAVMIMKSTSTSAGSNTNTNITANTSSLTYIMKTENEVLSNAPLLRARYMELAQARRDGADPPVLPSRVNAVRTVTRTVDGEEMDDVLLVDLNTAKVMLEEERGRLMNLELQASLDGESWKTYNQNVLEQDLAALKEKLVEQRIVVDRINAKRKDMQEAAIPKFQVLNKKWGSLVDKRFRLLGATSAMEREEKRLKLAHPNLVINPAASNSSTTT